MNPIVLERETYLPAIILDAEKGIFDLSGKCIPENASEFFNPILKWIDDYVASPNPVTNIQFRLEYFNTSTSKYLLEIMRKLENMYQFTDKDVKISWFFEEGDTDVEEAGLDYKAILKLPFEIITTDTDGERIDILEAVYPPRRLETGKKETKPYASQSIQDLAKELMQEAKVEINTQSHTAAEDLNVVTSISDRLQKKLNQANEKLQQQAEEINVINQNLNHKNKELQDTVDALTKARAGRKAATIVFFIAVGLFIVSEGIEWAIETFTQNVLEVYWIILMKLIIALLLKPIESLLESNILQHSAKSSLKNS